MASYGIIIIYFLLLVTNSIIIRLGRGSFQESSNIPMKLPTNEKTINWDTLRFIVFDYPDPLQQTNFETRFSLLDNINENHPFIVSFNLCYFYLLFILIIYSCLPLNLIETPNRIFPILY